MSFNNIKTNLRQDRGFTIVELLIVIVVIGILAAITIVSFNGVTARANSANAQSAAESTIKKIEAYNAEQSGYPATMGTTLLAAANSSTSYYLAGVTIVYSAVAAKPTVAATVSVQKCVNASSVIVGETATYWDYANSAAATMNTGTVSGTGITCSVIAS